MSGELEDSAHIDGASTFRIVTSVLRPLIVPGAATVALHALLAAWTEFLGALGSGPVPIHTDEVDTMGVPAARDARGVDVVRGDGPPEQPPADAVPPAPDRRPGSAARGRAAAPTIREAAARRSRPHPGNRAVRVHVALRPPGPRSARQPCRSSAPE